MVSLLIRSTKTLFTAASSRTPRGLQMRRRASSRNSTSGGRFIERDGYVTSLLSFQTKAPSRETGQLRPTLSHEGNIRKKHRRAYWTLVRCFDKRPLIYMGSYAK